MCIFVTICFLLFFWLIPISLYADNEIHLTLIPPAIVTNQVDLDIRGGVVNKSSQEQMYIVSLYWNKEDDEHLICRSTFKLLPGQSKTVCSIVDTEKRIGQNRVIFKVKSQNKLYRKVKDIEICKSDIRSTQRLSGAWTGIYHWSETEGKYWNKKLQEMTDSHWGEMVRAMDKLNMNIIVIQEVFRNEEYAGKHSVNVTNYTGKAFYPSNLYPGRMDIKADDPIEAILTEADRRNMNVFLGIGMFAWFDFTTESLEWHKRVAKELWEKYGHHESFYGFYISEESGGGLDNWEKSPLMRKKRKEDIVTFFKEFKAYCNTFAPGKPMMLATNSFDIPNGMDTYPDLLKHLDILCPFGFARMPKEDLKGLEAANLLQKVCDEAKAHLWFDLEVFLFNQDNSLYPRPIDGIIQDLNQFENFETILCYQFPGVFNDPEMSVCIGEKETIDLFNGYLDYLNEQKKEGKDKIVSEVKPITGTWINLAYQDVRNKYTNLQYFDNTDPGMWEQKVKELSDMGMEYLVFMAVANEGEAYYPSKLMPWAYSENRKSPVDAIMDAAARLGMKVFMSIGWAKDQDDNLRDPVIQQRQLDMMKELASIYRTHKALYGWYLPVEDCLCPILSEHAVNAVNALAEQARRLTPNKKILISPYGMVNSDFDDPEYERRLSRLKVDVITYQDEVGCVREKFPLVRLKENWQKLRTIHDKLNIALWANCETFTWEDELNDRTSALIPAAYSRLLSQQAAASAAGVENIVSFMFCGIIENPMSSFQLGQPIWSNCTFQNYMDWKRGTRYWKLLEASFLDKLANGATPEMIRDEKTPSALLDGLIAEENTGDSCWIIFNKGYHELQVDLQKEMELHDVLLRMLNYRPGGIRLPSKVYLYASLDGDSYRLLSIKDTPSFQNAKHDAWIDGVLFEGIDVNTRYLKVAFEADTPVYMDELFVNPVIR